MNKVRMGSSVSIALALAGCSQAASPNDNDVIGSSESALRRVTLEGTPPDRINDTPDASVDSGFPHPRGDGLATTPVGVLATDNPTSGGCTMQRFDVMLIEHDCWSLAQNTVDGIWSVAPIFGESAPALRNKACALTWIPSGPACKPANYEALTISCIERKTLTEREPACATDPAVCVAHPGGFLPAGAGFAGDLHCQDPPATDGGAIFRYGGGCSSCGVAQDGVVYGYNPFGDGPIGANGWNGGQFSSTGYSVNVPRGPFSIPIAGIPNGPVKISQ